MAATATISKAGKRRKMEGITQTKGFNIPFSQLKIEEGFNKRFDYGDIEELSDSIAKHGIKQPMVVRRIKAGKDEFYVVSGHRRYKATELAIKNGMQEPRVPCILEAKNTTVEQRYADMLLFNDGKEFSDLEKGAVYAHFKVSLNWSVQEIASFMGVKNIQNIYNAVRLYEAPRKIHSHIKDQRISSTAVMHIIRETDGNWDKAEKMIDQAIKSVKKDPSKKGDTDATATIRHVKGLKTKTPIQRLYEIVETADKKPELYIKAKVDTIRQIAEFLKEKGDIKDLLEAIKK